MVGRLFACGVKVWLPEELALCEPLDLLEALDWREAFDPFVHCDFFEESDALVDLLVLLREVLEFVRPGVLICTERAAACRDKFSRVKFDAALLG